FIITSLSISYRKAIFKYSKKSNIRLKFLQWELLKVKFILCFFRPILICYTIKDSPFANRIARKWLITSKLNAI
ncbi:MAG: hypothetical protein MUE85_02735, partial [Microscillaceae bacterium]|nr:hypothetical protein [Microscillaceae bacterium]